MSFFRTAWSTTDYSNVEIKTHACTAKELGLEQNDRKYMKPNKDSYNFIKLYQKKFLCIDEEDRYIYGNFYTDIASLIRVRLSRC